MSPEPMNGVTGHRPHAAAHAPHGAHANGAHANGAHNGLHANGTNGVAHAHAVVAAPADCCLTIDVEDWYQSSVDFSAPISSRVVRNTDRVRSVLDACGVRATFFVQGLVAMRYPRLAAGLLRDGHEVQSHGHTHRPLFRMNRDAVAREIDDGCRALEDAIGQPVTAFRAPDFSILQENLWVLEVLAARGLTVDSSIFPIATRRYGIEGWDLSPRHVALPGGASILEAPVAVLDAPGRRVPVAGGGYFRLLPGGLLEWALRRIVAAGRPAVIYAHPYEFNADEIGEFRGRVPARVLLHQGLGRSAVPRRVARLLRAFRFGRLDQVLAPWRVS